MKSIEEQLLEALAQLEMASRWKPSAGPKPDLQNIFARIDELTGRLPKGADPTLLHYLRNKSYEKARLLLMGREAENQAGRCRQE